MKNRYITLFLLVCYLTGVLITTPINNNVKALSSYGDFGFEGTTANTNITALLPVGSDNIFTSHKKGTFANDFCVSTSTVRSGTRSFYSVNGIQGWLNMSYSKTTYLTAFNIWLKPSIGSGYIYLQFYNNTIGYSNPLVFIKFSSYVVNYKDETWVDHVIDASYSNYYINIGFSINNSIGDVYYYTNKSDVLGVARNPSAIANGYRIDRILINTSTTNTYFDDMNWTLSDSYNITGGGTPEGCLDTSGLESYSNGELGIWTKSVNDNQMEFTSFYDIDCLPYAFELFVRDAQINFDANMNNYSLWVNGLFIGSPICYYQYAGSVYVIQWDLTSLSQINNTPVVFEFWHYSSKSNNYADWYLMATHDLDAPQDPEEIIYSGGLDDGVINPSSVVEGNGEYGSIWRLFYTVWQPTPPNPTIENSITLVGFHENHPVANLPFIYETETGFFQVRCNKTDGYYDLVISGEGSIDTLPIYKSEFYWGFTPSPSDYSYGYYTVNMSHDGTNIISIPFYVDEMENITPYDPDAFFRIWTHPNPSNPNGQHYVDVYISNFTKYDYYSVAGFLYNQNSASYDDSWHTLNVLSIDADGVWEGQINSFVNSGYEVWRLFGSMDGVSYMPLTNEYKHYIENIELPSIIRVNLTKNTGYINEEFTITGSHPYFLGNVAIFWDGNAIKTNIYTSFTYQYSSSVKGSHVLHMMLNVNGTWKPIGNNVTVKLIERGQGGGGGGGGFVFPTVNQPLGSILGMIITIFCLLTPFIVGASIHLNTPIHPIIYAMTGGMGLSISTIMGFFPVWIPLFVITCGIIVIVIFYIRNGVSSGE